MGGEYVLQTSNGNATVGDIVKYTLAIRNTGSVTLSTIELISPTVSATTAGASVRINGIMYQSDIIITLCSCFSSALHYLCLCYSFWHFRAYRTF